MQGRLLWDLKLLIHKVHIPKNASRFNYFESGFYKSQVVFIPIIWNYNTSPMVNHKISTFFWCSLHSDNFSTISFISPRHMNQILGFLTWLLYYEVLRGSRGVSFNWWSIWGAMVPHKVAFSHGQQHMVRSRYWFWIGVACVRIAERLWSIFCFIFLWLEMCDLLCLLYLEYLGLYQRW